MSALSNGRAFLGAAALVASTLSGAARAGDLQLIAADGTVHRILVSSWTAPVGVAGTTIRHQIQGASGAKQTITVPGTEDVAVERSPALGIDRVDGSLVLVWVREEAGSTHLRIARWARGAWTASTVLDGPRPGSGAPSLWVGAGWIHVAWSEGAGQAPTFWRAVYAKDSFAKAFGPEWMTTDVPLVPGAATEAPGATMPEGLDAYFTYTSPGPATTDPGRMYVWGIRDEPVPIGYAEGTEIATSGTDTRDSGVRAFGSSLTLWYHTGDRFFYRTRTSGIWGTARMVVLDAQTTPEAARLQVDEMLRRR
jgi:hypothetical protein